MMSTLRVSLVGGLWFVMAACASDPEPVGPPVEDADLGDVAAADADDADADVGSDAEPDAEGAAERPAPTLDGPWQPARTRFVLDAAERGRSLPVEVWYPSDDASVEAPLRAFGLDEAQAAVLAGLLGDAPEACPRGTYRAGEGAFTTSLTSAPLAILSHCHGCTRFNLATVAERLATHGWIVAAPDHVENTLFDSLRGELAELSGEFLITRGEDLRDVLDAMLGEGAPEAVRGRADAARVGAVGHSFGAVSVAWLAQRDARVGAVVAIAAPIENPLLPGVTAAEVEAPLLFLVAREDNSILAVGNRLIERNFDALPGRAARVELDDAGHWSFSDLNGLVEAFLPGCGEGERQTARGEAFTYLDPALGRAWTADWTTAWLNAEVLGDALAADWVASEPVAGVTVVRSTALGE